MLLKGLLKKEQEGEAAEGGRGGGRRGDNRGIHLLHVRYTKI